MLPLFQTPIPLNGGPEPYTTHGVTSQFSAIRRTGAMIMNVRPTPIAILAVAAIGIAAGSAMAKEVSIKGHSQSQVKGSCGGDGDVYWVPGSSGHTYGCLHGDGSGIVCSGVTPAQKKTCSTFRTGSFPAPKLPTRDEAGKAETTEKK